MDLEKIRKEIDKIDYELLKILHKRINIIKKIREIKKNENLNIYQPEREREIIKKILKFNNNIFPEESLINIYSEIFSASRKVQSPLKIGYLGPEATFSHQAALKIFGSQSIYIPFSTIRDVFNEVETGYIDLGVVPVENSSEGIVGYTIDLLIEFNLFIIDEIYLEIVQNLLSREKDIKKINTLYVHPQAYAQCRTFIENNFHNIKIIEASSTSESARLASQKKRSGAIASKIAAQLYNLNILAEGIQDLINNYTRFLVISKKPIENFKNNIKYKTSIVCGIKDRPGALFTLIKPFNDYKINMTKIESRPAKIKTWEYLFFIDFIGNKNNPKVIKALQKVEANSTYFKILGSYPAADNK